MRMSAAAGRAGWPVFPRADWLWRKIPPSPVLDTNSAAIAAALSAAGTNHSADMVDFGVTINGPSAITPATPRYSVTFANQNGGTSGLNWGPNPFGSGTMPIPSGVILATGSDKAMVTADPTSNQVYGLWQASLSGSAWSASWGGIADFNGDGRESAGSSIGAGFSRYAGLIRVSEISAGVIPHALFFSTDIAKTTTFRYPASKTDGANGAANAHPIEEGARVQLNPSINLAAIPGITAAEIAVGTALQQYGAYCGDNGGARMAFVFELASDGISAPPGSVYASKGLAWDYYDMTKIPWNQLRVLRHWDGS